jgi:1-deoxy-D-xylulose-5-phosphate synthase
MDEATFKDRASKVRLMVTLEENTLRGGFGEGVGCFLKAIGAGCGFLPLGLPDKFVAHGAVDDLFEAEGLDPHSVALAVIAALGVEIARDRDEGK